MGFNSILNENLVTPDSLSRFKIKRVDLNLRQTNINYCVLPLREDNDECYYQNMPM